jgi:hypothetical protein
MEQKQQHGGHHHHGNCCSHSHDQQQPNEYEYIRKEIRRDYKIEKEFFIDDIKYMVIK